MSTLLLVLCGIALAQDPEPSAAPPAEDALPLVEGPGVVEYVEAEYPPEALEAGVEGIVKLRIELSAEGEIESLEVIESPGYGFDDAAVDAVLGMTFSPARTAEGPIPVVFDFDYGFNLEPEVPEEEVPPPINLEGQVIEMATRRPIAGAKVAVQGTEIVGETDDEGRFQIRGVPLGEASLRILHVGHVTLE